MEVNVRSGAPIFETVTTSVAMHPLESSTIIVYAPAGIFVRESLFEIIGDQKYKYPGMPPDTDTLAAPFAFPQVAVVVDNANVISEG